MLNMKSISRVRFVRIFSILSILLMMQIPLSIRAQEADLFGAEDDSLLFGDEFDLGGDDTSFDFDDDSGADDSFNFDDEEDASDTESAEDDFFGDFEEETEAEETVADTVAEDDWGLDNSAGYDDLITRTVDGEPILLEEDYSHPLDFRDNVRGTILENTGFTISLYSPQYVADGLTTWHSYLDFSLTTALPWHIQMNPVELTFAIDISSFNFNNTFPSGGDFKGVSVMPMATVSVFGFELETGIGAYYPSFGALVGLGYSYQFHSIFFSTGYRWNWANNIDPIGANWWLEPRFTVGVRLW